METTSVPSTVTRQHQTNHAAPTPTNRSEPPRVAITFSFPPVLARNPRILEFASYPFGAAGIFCMANHRYVAGLSLLGVCAAELNRLQNRLSGPYLAYFLVNTLSID
ncbi:hypothetical protein AAKU58_000742 [Oxalobacteraceae bacterium GrIS 1.18]